MFSFYLYNEVICCDCYCVEKTVFFVCRRHSMWMFLFFLHILKSSVLFFSFVSSDMIYSEPYTHYRNRAEPQAPSEIHRRGNEEILQIHHGHVSSIGNGQVRLQSNYNQIPNNIYANQRRDVAPILAFDPHLSRLISSSLDRRESSASATSSVGSSYESGSTLTSDLGDNAIMTRLRKSVEQKEEFLRGAPVTQSQTHGVNNGDVGE